MLETSYGPTPGVRSFNGRRGNITAVAADISDASPDGRSLLQADTEGMKTLLAIASGDVSGLGGLATVSSVTAEQISDASANGRSILTAVDYAAIKILLSLVKADVGLGNADNTSDANKDISIAQQAALDLKAALNSPALTGTPTVPNQTAGDNSTKIANTAYVEAAIAVLAAVVSGALVFKTGWDASSGVFPGAGVAQTGWFYKVTVAGTVDDVDFSVGDDIYAATNNASAATYPGNWLKIEGSITLAEVEAAVGFNFGTLAALSSVTAALISDASANGRSFITAANYAAMKTLLAIAAGDVSGLGDLATLSTITASLISNASANGRSLITAADYAAMKTLLAIVVGDVSGAAPLASPAFTGIPSLHALIEKATVSATAATGTINLDAMTQAVLFYTSNASANFTPNVRGDGSNALNDKMAVGDSLTVAFLAMQGATPYYASAFQIDGSAVTPKWQGGVAPAAGNASGIDVYVYTIIKTAANTYTVLASLTQFK